MVKELNPEEGIQEILNGAKKITDRPVLAAIYGNPLSGAANFVEEVACFAHDHNKRKRVKNLCYPTVLKAWQNYHFRLLNTLFYSARIQKDYLYLLHCPWEKGNPDFIEEDPHKFVENINNIEINFNVGVYNPDFSSGIKGKYDFIVVSYFH